MRLRGCAPGSLGAGKFREGDDSYGAARRHIEKRSVALLTGRPRERHLVFELAPCYTATDPLSL